MGLLQLIEAVGEAWSRWAGAHPVRAVLAVVAVVIGSTVSIKKLDLPIYKWARDWIVDWPDQIICRASGGVMEVKC